MYIYRGKTREIEVRPIGEARDEAMLSFVKIPSPLHFCILSLAFFLFFIWHI